MLALAQKVFGAIDLFIRIGLRQFPRLKAHLGRELQKLRLQMPQIRVLAQMLKPRLHALELGRQAKHALAVRGMGMGIGARHVMHVHGKAAVAALQPGNPQIGGQIEQQQEHQPRQAQLQPHARLRHRLPAEKERNLRPWDHPEGGQQTGNHKGRRHDSNQ